MSCLTSRLNASIVLHETSVNSVAITKMSEEELTEIAYKNLLETLSYLASINIQEKFIIGGTKEEYIVPDDLLEDLLSKVEFFKFEKFPNRIKWLKLKVGERAFGSIEEIYSDIKTNSRFLENYTHENISDLIKADPEWLKLRDKSIYIKFM